jgi:uncharacterized membrane protein
VGALAVLAVATAIGLIALWPGDSDTGAPDRGATERADVVGVSSEGCREIAGPGCRSVEFMLEDGERGSLTLPGAELAPEIDPGDGIRVARNELPEGTVPGAPEPEAYAFVDFERRAPLIWLALGFGLLVVVLGRRRGVLSLVGLAISLVLVVEFVVPAILDGRAPLLVALVGALAIMFATITLTHGANVKSAAAMLGTAASLLLTALLALLFVELAHITGFSSEEATLLQGASGRDLSLEGLVLAGMVIGALGVLDDVTVSQASTVMALRRANPAQRLADLYRSALAVGRDHLGATVNTLVLAYAGAALPILLIFSNQGTSFGEAVNRESVATEIVATLVGSIGLVAAVPLTTALAALLASRLPPEVLPEPEYGHAH